MSGLQFTRMIIKDFLMVLKYREKNRLLQTTYQVFLVATPSLSFLAPRRPTLGDRQFSYHPHAYMQLKQENMSDRYITYITVNFENLEKRISKQFAEAPLDDTLANNGHYDNLRRQYTIFFSGKI